MTTINERVEELIPRLLHDHESADVRELLRELLRTALSGAARDQRHACAEAVGDMSNRGGVSNDERRILTLAHQEIVNATIK